ncbi:peptidoglycan-binding protein [Lysobacter sp. Root690]|uniref:peptidoglycan-binding domain-containing protein n=1 Tax=Lysobacter sp. Root690 TaxID=1736588 RepID=UPI0006FD2745|nr:peptidoglycan-binding protein [Lysobacter sp. Root690]KRB11210.1 hypothetical protein ASD86_01895 [Lysobacter sp. Root690]
MSNNPLLELMYRGESGAAGYNAYNRGTYTDDAGRERIRGPNGPIDFSQMTLGQVMDRQALPNGNDDRVFAVGKYQIIPQTMRGAVAEMGLDRNQPFTPALQDKVFSEYLIVDKRPEVAAYITGKPGATLAEAQHGLSKEWASFGDPNKNGASHYGGANHASISLQQSADALNQMRTEYKANIDKGMKPDDAWKATTGDDPNRTLPASITTPGSSQRAPRDAMADGVLKPDERGPAVTSLQEQLNKAGFRDAQGNELKPDGHYGKHTKEAVEAFQRANNLEVDGKAGPKTLEALKNAQPAGPQAEQPATTKPGEVQLSNPAHPDNAMYKQAVAGLEKLGPQAGFKDHAALERAAGTMTYEARVSGMTKIDHVVPNASGTGLFAVQGELRDPASQRVVVDKAQASSQSIEQSTQQLKQDAPTQNQTQEPAQERQQPKTMMA